MKLYDCKTIMESKDDSKGRQEQTHFEIEKNIIPRSELTILFTLTL